MRVVAGLALERTVDVGQTGRGPAAGARLNVLDPHRSGGSPVRCPELWPVDAIVHRGEDATVARAQKRSLGDPQLPDPPNSFASDKHSLIFGFGLYD
jgi:hypothetical protein